MQGLADNQKDKTWNGLAGSVKVEDLLARSKLHPNILEALQSMAIEAKDWKSAAELRDKIRNNKRNGQQSRQNGQ